MGHDGCGDEECVMLGFFVGGIPDVDVFVVAATDSAAVVVIGVVVVESLVVGKGNAFLQCLQNDLECVKRWERRRGD